MKHRRYTNDTPIYPADLAYQFDLTNKQARWLWQSVKNYLGLSEFQTLTFGHVGTFDTTQEYLKEKYNVARQIPPKHN